MLSQLGDEICYVGREGFQTIPVEDSNGGAGVNNRIPKMNFGRREIKDGGDAEGNEAKGLKVGK